MVGFHLARHLHSAVAIGHKVMVGNEWHTSGESWWNLLGVWGVRENFLRFWKTERWGESEKKNRGIRENREKKSIVSTLVLGWLRIMLHRHWARVRQESWSRDLWNVVVSTLQQVAVQWICSAFNVFALVHVPLTVNESPTNYSDWVTPFLTKSPLWYSITTTHV